MEKKKTANFKTTVAERNSYASYFVGQNIFYTLVTNFLVTYMMFQGIDLSKTAFVMLIIKIWDAVNDALFGAIFDKVKFKSGKKCIPWIKISTVFISAATIFLFSIPSSFSEGAKLIWFAIGYLLWDTAYTFCDVPIYAMVTTMTDNIPERNTLMARGRIFSGFGIGIALLLCTVLVSEKVGLSFSVIACILSFSAIAFMVPICINGKERNYHSENAEDSYTLKQMIKYLSKNKYLLIFCGGYLIGGFLATNVTLSLFMSYYLFNSATFNIVLTLIASVPSLILAVFVPSFLKKIDKYKLFIITNVLTVVIGLTIFFVGYENVGLFVFLTCLKAVPAAVSGILLFMFTPDCAEYGRFKTGIDAKGITFAVQTFTAKVTAAVSSSLALFFLGLFGWVTVNASSFADLEKAGVVQSAGALNGLWITTNLIPVIGTLLSLCFFLFYHLKDSDVQVMAKINSGEISREEGLKQLSRKY